MRLSGVLLALVLVFVGSSARQDVSDSGAGSGLSASVSAVHVLSVPSPDACWALCACERPLARPDRVSVGVVGGQPLGTLSSGPGSSRAPPPSRLLPTSAHL
ncbi:hypothetical protein [Lentzea aerocolonigenes]|uniref:hypothetical protein n=1 Tax=Lentzea aerocolonigenes TaxID=68170 RepID=UPI000AE1DAB8|nr:hypothetical protein [Lentzea aerocolonigenes]